MLQEVQLEENEMLQPVCSMNIGWLHVMIFRSVVDVLMCLCTVLERYVLGWRERQWWERLMGRCRT